jgi:hypothetical protein
LNSSIRADDCSRDEVKEPVSEYLAVQQGQNRIKGALRLKCLSPRGRRIQNARGWPPVIRTSAFTSIDETYRAVPAVQR